MDMTYTPALIIQHCALFGRLETPARAYGISPVRTGAKGPEVSVRFIPPGKRTAAYYTMRADNLRYLTIEVQGAERYDSRTQVPCDMDSWTQTYAQWKDNPPMRTIDR